MTGISFIRIWTLAGVLWLEIIRRKDVYILLVLLGGLLLSLVSLNIFNLGGVGRYVMDVGLLMTWLLAWLLAINVGTRGLPQEESRGTVYALLAKPVTRAELVLGKWLGSWTVAAAATAVFYALVVGVVMLRGSGVDGLTLLQGYTLHAAALAVITAIGTAFSTRMNHDAAAAMTGVVTGASFLLVPRIPALVLHSGAAAAQGLLVAYHFLPHLEVFDMRRRIVHDYGPASWQTFSLVLLYGAAVTACFLLVAWLAYRRKLFSRGALT